MPRARLIATNGPWLEAVIEIDGRRLTVMDEFSVMGPDTCPQPGQEFEVELSSLLLEDEPWEAIFAGNPGRRVGLDQLDGWRYRAFGRVISIAPVIVDCGLLRVEDVVRTHDTRVIGEYLAFTISRLGGQIRAIASRHAC
jgi:hypothetical protein